MCGIAGYFGQGNREILQKMACSLTHRGPDDEGFYIDENCGLGHRRLSIIDLSPLGHQPMSNEDNSVQVIFNGEIYNFQALRKELESNHKFKGSSDTEVIVHLYEEVGEKVFERLEGMFAIALYDKKHSKLLLARDRLGKKPLYWGIFNNTLIFGSEIKTLLQYPNFKKELDLCSLNKYLLFEYVPTPNSIFKNVKKLEPGHYLSYNGQEVVKKAFWKIIFNRSFEGSFSEAVAELDTLLNKAVKARLVSDVPLGIFLSGGLDSSTVAYYAQKNSSQKIKTFSIGFKEKSFDESKYARLVAAHLSTEHHEQIFSAADCLDLVSKIADILDEPLADASILPTYLLSKFTKQKVTVALGGDGGDELFCGYDTFIAHRLADIYKKIPLWFRQDIIEKIVLNLPVSLANFSFDFRAKKFIQGFNQPIERRNQIWLGSFDRSERAKLFLPEVWQKINKDNEFEEIDNYLNGVDNLSKWNKLILLYLRTYLMDGVLVKVDRASMANSLEVRTPFLDRQMVDFSNSLPLDWKIKGLKTKYILKRLMQDKLPLNIVNRKKKGFGVPLAQWLTSDLRPLALDLLSKNVVEKEGLFSYQYIKKLLDDHFARRADNRKLIWTLLVWQLWRAKWGN